MEIVAWLANHREIWPGYMHPHMVERLHTCVHVFTLFSES